jgi:hypothetical protein
MENQYDFDYLDEQGLSSILKIGNGSLTNMSGQSYTTIIIPSITAISKTALSKLQEFSTAGGKVVFLGNLPNIVVEKSFLNAIRPGDLNWALNEPSGNLTDRVIETLKVPDLKIDKKLPQIKYLHRVLKDADLYFIFNENKEPVSFNASFGGKNKMEIWDANSGKISSFKGSEFSLQPWETKFVIIKK